MKISFERLVSRSIVRFISGELDLAGVKTSVNAFLGAMIMGSLALFVVFTSYVSLGLGLHIGLAALAGMSVAGLYVLLLYAFLEYKVENRRNLVEVLLPDYIQLTAANIRSGIPLDKAMLAAARPEFKHFSDDIMLFGKQIYAGETMQNGLTLLGKKYRSRQLQHTIRMMIESLRYGGGMNDLLTQIAKDLRAQAMIQKEISGQLLMYTIFIAFAALIGAPALYALTNKMIAVTNTVWAGILRQNPGGLPTVGVSFLRPSPPQITIQQYYIFSLASVMLITALGAFIVSAISSGSIVRGIRFLPIFILIGLGVFYMTSAVIGNIFSSIGPG